MADHGWVLYPFGTKNKRFLSSKRIQQVLEEETFKGFNGGVKGGRDRKLQRKQRVKGPPATYIKIRDHWMNCKHKKSYIVPNPWYKPKKGEGSWQTITLDRKETDRSTPNEKDMTRMFEFGKAVVGGGTRTLLEEGIECTLEDVLLKHMGKCAREQMKKQNSSLPKSHHLATPQMEEPTHTTDDSDDCWKPLDVNSGFGRKIIKIKTVTVDTLEALKEALGQRVAQALHRDYVDDGCEAGALTAIVTTACSARIAIVEGSHHHKDGEAFKKRMEEKPLEQIYTIVEIPPYSVLLMNGFLFHAGCRYFVKSDHQKNQGVQIGERISYRSHHYVLPHSSVDPTNHTSGSTGVRSLWWDWKSQVQKTKM